jgi:hypothetical protein
MVSGGLFQPCHARDSSNTASEARRGGDRHDSLPDPPLGGAMATRIAEATQPPSDLASLENLAPSLKSAS